MIATQEIFHEYLLILLVDIKHLLLNSCELFGVFLLTPPGGAPSQAFSPAWCEWGMRGETPVLICFSFIWEQRMDLELVDWFLIYSCAWIPERCGVAGPHNILCA